MLETWSRCCRPKRNLKVGEYVTFLSIKPACSMVPKSLHGAMPYFRYSLGNVASLECSGEFLWHYLLPGLVVTDTGCSYSNAGHPAYISLDIWTINQTESNFPNDRNKKGTATKGIDYKRYQNEGHHYKWYRYKGYRLRRVPATKGFGN